MNYGQIRLRISQMAPGVSRELIDGWIQDVYTEMLDSLPWKRLEAQSIVQPPQSYAIGTVAVQQGSASIVGTGTAWTADMTGRMIRINDTTEWYTFTFVDATHATLDRNYESSTQSIAASGVGAAGVGYVVGDQFWISGGGNGQASGIVLSVSQSGGVTSYSLENDGNNYSVANGVATTGGSGVGLTINITQVGGSSGLSYRIDQAVFSLPDGCRILRGVKALHQGGYPLELITPGELDRRAAGRLAYGNPTMAAATWDDQNDPPTLQIEFYPIPDTPDSAGNLLSFEVDYVYDPADLDPLQTSASLLPWARPAAITEGVMAKIDQWRASSNPQAASAYLAAAAAHRGDFDRLLATMARINAAQRGPKGLRLSEEYVGRKPPRWHRGPWHEGFPG